MQGVLEDKPEMGGGGEPFGPSSFVDNDRWLRAHPIW